MRLAVVHCDHLAVEAATPTSEAPPDRPGTATAVERSDALFAVAGVDAVDAAAPERVASAAADQITEAVENLTPAAVVLAAPPATTTADVDVVTELLRDVADAVGVETTVLAPDAHLAVDATARGHPFAFQVRDVDASRLAPRAAPRPTPARDDWERLGSLRLVSEAGGWTPAGTAVRDCLAALASETAEALSPVAVETPGVVPVDDDALAAAVAAAGHDPVRTGRTAALRPWPHLGHLGTLAGREPPAAVHETATVTTRGPEEICERRVPAVTALRSPGALGESVEAAVAGTTAALDALGLAPTATVAGDGDLASHAVEYLERETGVGVTQTDEPDAPWGLSVRVAAPGAAGPLSVGSLRVAPDASRVAPSLPADTGLVGWRPIGSLGTALAATVAAGAERSPPRLPDWLAPTQVRVVPVAPTESERAAAVVNDLRAAGVRADIDARERPVGERLGTADRTWVPATAVVGPDDREGAVPTVEDRRTRTDVDGDPEAVRAALAATDGPDVPPPSIGSTDATLRYLLD